MQADDRFSLPVAHPGQRIAPGGGRHTCHLSRVTFFTHPVGVPPPRRGPTTPSGSHHPVGVPPPRRGPTTPSGSHHPVGDPPPRRGPTTPSGAHHPVGDPPPRRGPTTPSGSHHPVGVHPSRGPWAVGSGRGEKEENSKFKIGSAELRFAPVQNQALGNGNWVLG